MDRPLAGRFFIWQCRVMGAVTNLYESAVAAGRVSPDPAQRAVLPALDQVVAALNDGDATSRQGGLLSRLFARRPAEAPVSGPQGLYLWGGVGRGKSMLMDMLTEVSPVPVRRVHFHAFMQEIQSGLNAARQRGERDAIRPVAVQVAQQARLLCFDEMQITDIADAMIVGRLFQLLFEKGVVIVTTSNRVPDDLYKNGLNRQLFLPFIALIKQRMQVVELVSARDHRQDRLAGHQVWFAPLGADAQAEMDVLWQGMTDGDQIAPLVLDVKGRQVTLPAHDDGVARASFADLCAHALGPADYLAMADAVSVMFIDQIPQLDQTAFNEAKRFVTLIDALYEAKTRVIASAATQPEQLYGTGEGAFEFERTASRLREMQDANWGRDREGQRD